MTSVEDRQSGAYKQLRTYVEELFEDSYEEEESGHIYVRYGSTVLEISVEPYGPEETSIILMAYCVQGVELEEGLLVGLLELNHSLPFGAFSVVGQDIFFSYTLFGRTLERSNLLGGIAAVAEISDQYDDRIVAKYGGQRALDRIRDTGGRKRRQESTQSNDD